MRFQTKVNLDSSCAIIDNVGLACICDCGMTPRCFFARVLSEGHDFQKTGFDLTLADPPTTLTIRDLPTVKLVSLTTVIVCVRRHGRSGPPKVAEQFANTERVKRS